MADNITPQESITGTQATERTFTPTRGGAFQYNAMRRQVLTDWKRDDLASKYQQKSISGDQYMQGLSDLLKKNREGSVIERDLESAIIGVAQQEYEDFTKDEQEAIQKMTQEVDLEWARVQREFADGNMSVPEFKERQKKYEEYHRGLIDMEIPEFEFGKFGPGAERPTGPQGRMKAIDELFRKVLGRPAGKGPSDYVTGKFRYAPLPWVEKTLELSEEGRKKTGAFYSYGLPRNLSAEQQSVGSLVSQLGRLPSPEEVNAIVYGKYPIEFVKSGNYSKTRGFFE